MNSVNSVDSVDSVDIGKFDGNLSVNRLKSMDGLKDKANKYSANFVDGSSLSDEKIRYRKADKILAILKEEGVLPNPNAKLLDIGCSFGLILERFESFVDYRVGVDLDQSAMRQGNKETDFVATDAEYLPFASETFDVVICNHVYEHTDHAELLMAEILRIMTPSGVCYFCGPNKYDLVEPHYKLPFLSWLPKWMADKYVRITGKGNGYPEKPYSYRKLLELLSEFEKKDFTGRVVNDPVKYCVNDILPIGSVKHKLARFILKFMPFIFPDFIYVLRKK